MALASRDSLLDAVRYGRMTPVQAEAMAKLSGLPPLASRPNIADYNATAEPWWTLPMTVAWIAWRSHAEVIGVWDVYRLECSDWHFREWRLGPAGELHEGYFLEQRQPATLPRLMLSEMYRRSQGTLPADAISMRDAIAKLRKALGENATQATGLKVGTWERTVIPDHEWHDLEFFEEGGRDVARPRVLGPALPRGYHDLAFRRQHVMAIWQASLLGPRATPETHSGGAGRPSAMHLVKAEYDRRKERGEISGGIGKVAADLAAWAKATYPMSRTPTARTIENALRAKHRQGTK